MTTQHSLLDAIREAVATSGTHSHQWGDLRRQVFHGIEGWNELKAWCEANALHCELTYGQSSRATDVQFRVRKPA